MNLKSNQKNPRIELPKIGVNLNYTLSNNYNGADLMFLFQESLSLIIRGLSFNSIAIFLLPMGSHLSPTLANAFLVYYKKNWLQGFSHEHRPFYYRRYVDHISVLFNSSQHLKCFQSFLKSCHVSIPFTIENEKDKYNVLS